MHNIYRFASLNGRGQRYLEGNEALLDGETPAPDVGDTPEHDGWMPIPPRRKPLATLGDLLARRDRGAARRPRR